MEPCQWDDDTPDGPPRWAAGQLGAGRIFVYCPPVVECTYTLLSGFPQWGAPGRKAARRGRSAVEIVCHASHRSAEQSERDRIVVFRRDNRDSNKNPETFSRQLETLRQQPAARRDDRGDQDDEFEPEAEDVYDHEPVRDTPPRQSTLPQGSAFPAYGRDSAPLTGPGMDNDQSAYSTSQPTSVVAADTIWRGDMESNGDVHIHGQFQGTVTARTDIFVSEDAEADATLIANSVVIAGNVKGVIRASTRLEILPQGRISGEVIAPTVIAHDGARVNATVRMTLTPEEQAGTPPRVSTTTRRTSRPGVRY